MFANVGWGEMILLVVVGLVVLGPERLPGAIRWASSTIRQARDYLTGATSQADVERSDIRPTYIIHQLADLLPDTKPWTLN